MTCIQWKDLEVKLKDHTKHPEQWALELTTRRQSLAGDSGSLWSQALRFSSRLLAPGRRCELCQPQLSHLQQSSLWGLPVWLGTDCTALWRSAGWWGRSCWMTPAPFCKWEKTIQKKKKKKSLLWWNSVAICSTTVFKFYLFIFGCAGSSLPCGLFSSCGERGLPFVVVCGLTTVASLVAKHGRCGLWAW